MRNIVKSDFVWMITITFILHLNNRLMVQSVPLANFYEIKPQTLHFPPLVPEENSPEKRMSSSKIPLPHSLGFFSVSPAWKNFYSSRCYNPCSAHALSWRFQQSGHFWLASRCHCGFGWQPNWPPKEWWRIRRKEMNTKAGFERKRKSHLKVLRPLSSGSQGFCNTFSGLWAPETLFLI